MGFQTSRAPWIAALLMLAPPVAIPAAAEGPKMTAVRTVVRVPAGAQEGLAEIIFQTAGPQPADATGVPTLKSEPPNIEFGEAIELAGGSPDRRMWRVPVTVRGLPAAGSSSVRTATVTWGTSVSTFPYILSNAAAPALTWKVSGLPAEVKASDGWCQPIRIGLSGARATGILVTATLVEQSTRRPLTGLHLRTNDAAAETDPATLEAAVNDGTSGIKVCLANASAKPGKYLGIVNVSAAEKPEGDPQSTTVYVSGFGVRLFGAVLLALGCVLAYALRVLAPARVAQRQALLAAAVLREQAEALKARLSAETAPRTITRLDEAVAKLQKATLIAEGLIAPDVPLPFGAAPDSAKFKARLEEVGGIVGRLAIVVVEGIVKAQAIGGPNLPAVLAALDNIGDTAPTATNAAVTAQVQTALAALGLPQGAPAGAPGEPGSQHLVVEIAAASTFVWVGMVLLTWTIGLFVLVLNNPGFGVPMDYLYCLIWGFGLPAVGQQLTGTSASTALGITLPAARP